MKRKSVARNRSDDTAEHAISGTPYQIPVHGNQFGLPVTPPDLRNMFDRLLKTKRKEKKR